MNSINSKTKAITTVAILLLITVCLPLSKAYAQGQGKYAPSLILPTDGDTLTTANPTFTWLQSFPLAGMSYEFRLVEILSNRSPQAAISSNQLMYKSGSQAATVLIYPISAPLLESGKSYAWQIVTQMGKDSKKPIFSNVYHFTYKVSEPKEEIPEEISVFFEPNVKEDARVFEQSSEWLPISLSGKYKTHKLKYEVTASDGSKVELPSGSDLVVKYGENRLLLYIGKLESGIYSTVIKLKKGDKLYLKFRIRDER